MKYYSLHDLDRKIERHLDFEGGVFFEAGANNGVDFSNTAHFEFDRSWRGILVEPIPERIAEARANRPRSHCVHAALVPEDYTLPEAHLTYCNMMTVTRDPDRAWDGMSHIEKGLAILKKRNEEVYEFTAPARTISSILDEWNISRVDLMSLDVEGFEHLALRGLDHDRHIVSFICVEAVGAAAFNKIMEILNGRYSLVEQLSHHDYLLKRVE